MLTVLAAVSGVLAGSLGALLWVHFRNANEKPCPDAEVLERVEAVEEAWIEVHEGLGWCKTKITELDGLDEQVTHRIQLLRQEWDDYYEKIAAREARIDAKKRRDREREEREQEDVPPWELVEGEAPEASGTPSEGAPARQDPASLAFMIRNGGR